MASVNLVVSDRVSSIYFHVKNQRNKYLLVPGTSAFLLNKNNLVHFFRFLINCSI